MKRKLFNMTGVLAVLLLALGLVLVGCPTDSDDGGGGGETFPAAKGKLTINGIPSDKNGKYAFVSGTVGGTSLLGVTDITGFPSSIAYKMVKVADGKAEVPLYKANLTATSSANAFSAYEGNDTVTTLTIILITDDDGSITQSESSSAMTSAGADNMKLISSGTFSNGNLTYTWQ